MWSERGFILICIHLFKTLFKVKKNTEAYKANKKYDFLTSFSRGLFRGNF